MDKSLVLVAVGASQVLGGAGNTPSVSLQQGNNEMAVQLAFTGGTLVRFFVEVSKDGGTEYKKVACSAQFKAAAASGGEPARKVTIAALGLDYVQCFDVVPDTAAGFVIIPFRAVHGENLVRIYADAACTITHAEIVNYVS